MSSVRMCPMPTHRRLLASTTAAHAPVAASYRRRPRRNTHPIVRSPSPTGHTRAVALPSPNSVNAAAVAQYWSGGFSK